MPTVEYDLTGDTSQLVTAVDRAIKSFEVLDTKAATATKTVEKTATSTNKAGASFKDATEALDKLGQDFGGLGGQAAKSAAGIGKGVQALGGLSAALGPVGVAIGAAAVALSGLALGMGLAVGGALSLIGSAKDLQEELKGLNALPGFQPIDKDAQRSIDNVNAAMTALGKITSQLWLTLAANLAPAFEDVTFLAVKLALRAMDMFQTFAEGKSLLRETANFLVKEFLQALISPVDAIYGLIGAMGQLAATLGMGKDNVFLRAQAGYEAFSKAVASKIVDGALGAADGAMKALGSSTSDLDERARALLSTLQAETKEFNAQVQTLEQIANYFDRSAELSDKYARIQQQIMADQQTAASRAREAHAERGNQIYQEISWLERALRTANLAADERFELEFQLDAYKQLAADNDARRERDLTKIKMEEDQKRLEHATKVIDAHRAKEAAAAEASRREIEMIRDARNQMLVDITGATQDMADHLVQSLRGGTEEQKKQAKTAYAVSKAAAVAQIAIQAAVAIMRALAELGPIAGGFAAAGVGATAAVQTAKVLSTPMPEFPFGGMINPDALRGALRLSPDHGLVSAEPGEAVMNRGAVNRMGGPAAVEAMNRGQVSTSPGPMVIQQVYGHRVFDTFISDNLKKGGPLDATIAAAYRGRFGQRR
jgi:hypothetical protein